MAKAKKEVVQDEILEQEVETEVTKTKDVETKETKPKTVKEDPIKEDPLAEMKAKFLQKALEKANERKKMMKVYCKKDTPYLKVPNINNNVAGIIPKGTMLYVEEIVDNFTNGKFYKIHKDMYVNTKWDIDVL